MAHDSGFPAGSNLPVVKPVGEAAREGLGARGGGALNWLEGSERKEAHWGELLHGGTPAGMARTSGRCAQRLSQRALGSRRGARIVEGHRIMTGGELSMWMAKANGGLPL
jgi:hypothetical protein